MEESVPMIQYVEARTRQCEPLKNESNGIKMDIGKRRNVEQGDDGERYEAQQAPAAVSSPIPASAASHDPTSANRSALYESAHRRGLLS
jgi:hypothetical protein